MREGRTVGRLVLGTLVGVVATAAPPSPAGAQTAEDIELLERYAPVVSIRRHTSTCGDGERYLPVAVETIFGRDGVFLRDAADEVVAEAPTAADLLPGDPDLWIDLPGNALRPGCTYEQWFATLDAEAAMYGRLVSDEGHLVAQYWFYWIFNQWNDVHEGDWEMVQLDFGVTDLAGALADGPARYAYAQHEGSEYADVRQVNETKVQLVDDTHPVVHAGQGSHASYFGDSHWFGKSSATGFGCDDTTAPNTVLRPELIVLPSGAPPTEGPFAWLAYEGHWGQRERAFNNGPTGPVTKGQWAQPIEWVDELGRSGAIALPFAGSSATSTFCDLAAWGSAEFNEFLDQPFATIAFAVLGAAAVVATVTRSSQGLLRRAGTQWWRRAGRLLPVGAVILLGIVGSSIVIRLLEELTPFGVLVDSVGGSSPWVLPIVTVVSAIVVVPAYAWATSATVAVVDGAPTAGAALRRPLAGHRPAILPTIALVGMVFLALLVFFPLLLICSRWLVAPVLNARGDMTLKQALGRSHRLVMGHGLRAVGLLATLLIVIASAGVVGAVLLLLTPASFAVAGVVTAFLLVAIVPYIALVLVGFYDELIIDRAPFVPTTTDRVRLAGVAP